jgi:RNA polymerase sigma factor (sigma-70 family)
VTTDPASHRKDSPLLDALPDGFEEFYRSEVASIFGLMRSMGYDWDLAQDVVQDAMVQLLQQWRDVENPRAWVRVVALRMARKALQKRAREIPGEALLEDVADDKAESDSRMLELRDILRSLPLRQREVVVLYYLEGLTSEQVAQELGMSRTTVGRYLHVARVELRKRLSASSRNGRDLL